MKQAIQHSSGWLEGVTLTLLSAISLVQSGHAEANRPPPKPAIAPLISVRYPNDANGDRLDDNLSRRAEAALAAEETAASPDEKFSASVTLAEWVDVELTFGEQITQQQIDNFRGLGGEIIYVYRAVSFGWNGRIALHRIRALPAAMGASLVLVDGQQATAQALYEATRTGRVRPIWVPGFAGSTSGFSGDTNITIGILDFGVDDTHPDLTGRGVFSSNYTDTPFPPSADVAHGTSVAGVAVGSGAASGSGTVTLRLTYFNNLSAKSNGGFITAPINLPSNAVTVAGTARWIGGSPSGTRLHWAYHTNASAPSSWNTLGSIVGVQPLNFTTAPQTGTGDRGYAPALIQSNSISDFVINYRLTNYPGLGDGFNRLRGVAPGCNWASGIIGNSYGTGIVAWTTAAIDDFVFRRVENNIKVIVLSSYVTSGVGQNLSLRQKVNSAVNNGIVMVVAAGNEGRKSPPDVRDPGRAALALTVGAANDINQLTEYTSHGFDPTFATEQDFKPDLMSPGGSEYYTYIIAPDNNGNDGPSFTDQQADDYTSFHGTSRSTPFAAGCAALVIDAMHKHGVQWDFDSSQHSLYVKMLLCATASESNLPREAFGYDPSLERASGGPNNYPAGKDPYEGYGMINSDAAVEAVSLSYTNGTTNSATLGEGTSDRRAWARTMNLEAGKVFAADLIVPPEGDFDFYLYSNTPSTNGTPVLLAYGTQAGNGVNEMLNYLAETNAPALLVIKRVSGFGAFSFVGVNYPLPSIISPGVIGDDFTMAFESIPGRTYDVEYKDNLDDPIWQFLQSVPGDGTVKTVTNSVSVTAQRFFRLNLQ